MDNQSQVLLRNETLLRNGRRTLLVGMPADGILAELNPDVAFTWDYAVYEACGGERVDNLYFSPELPECGQFGQVIIYQPKTREALNILLEMLIPRIEHDGDIFLVGEKREGISGAAKILADYGDDAQKVDMARHCQLWQLRNVHARSDFNLDDWVKWYEVSAQGCTLKVATMPGVFSAGHLDEGTSLLLDSFYRKPTGRVLDFGCGSGVIGGILKLMNPECQVEMVDSNALALYCARKTLEANQLEATVLGSNGFSATRGRYHQIYTNPPFHQGVKTNYSVTENFIGALPQKLVSGGRLMLVANSFLKYAPVIESALGVCKVLAENNKFKVYAAQFRG